MTASKLTQGHQLLHQFSDAMADIIATVQHALVQITDGQGSIGSGTIWHADGLVLTNAHVVLGRPQRHAAISQRPNLAVTLEDGTAYPVQVIAIDEKDDLAALAITAHDLPTITPGDSTNMRPGQWVMALGHPWGVRNALTAGVVIGMGNDLPEMQPGREWIALNLRLRPGHSGGPLVDTSGRLLGINTMISGPEVGFAVPIHVVKHFLKDHLGRTHTPQESDPSAPLVQII